jgi:hypothetical protein
LTTEYGSGCGDAVMVLGEDERDGSKKERERWGCINEMDT